MWIVSIPEIIRFHSRYKLREFRESHALRSASGYRTGRACIALSGIDNHLRDILAKFIGVLEEFIAIARYESDKRMANSDDFQVILETIFDLQGCQT